MTGRRLVFVGGLAMIAIACHPPKPLHRFKIVVSALSDDGIALANVRVAVNGSEVGLTGEEGGLAIKLLSHEGQVVRVQASCPEGYRAPPEPTLLQLHAFERQDRVNTLRVTSTCKPKTRTAAVLVRAPGWGGLPIRLLGNVVGHTDDTGVAHLLLEKLSPATRFQLTLDTSRHPRLRPISPTQTFAIEDADRLFVFEQRLEQLPLPRKRRRPRKLEPLAPLPEVMPSIYTPKWKLRQLERQKKQRDEERRKRGR
jgi:hypothetical protein